MVPGSSLCIKARIMWVWGYLLRIHMLHIYIGITPVYGCHNLLYITRPALQLHCNAAVPFIFSKARKPLGLRKALYEPAEPHALDPAIGLQSVSSDIIHIISFKTAFIEITSYFSKEILLFSFPD